MADRKFKSLDFATLQNHPGSVYPAVVRCLTFLTSSACTLLSNLASLMTEVETALLTRNRKTLVNLACF